ncbi:MAG: hypothetical protein K0S93_206 [Nitrososphaeraceae archaeon]|jgi:hypothetical protein|nr:hypothetical protein [Nitrososphaeraceae archaeon]
MELEKFHQKKIIVVRTTILIKNNVSLVLSLFLVASEKLISFPGQMDIL